VDTPANGVNHLIMRLSSTRENTRVETHHVLKMKLAAESVDRVTGVLRGCTVAQAGVEATGKYIMVDAQGLRTFEEELCVRELPVWTDEKTLETLMTAAAAAPQRVKAREDHDDSIGARAGYAGAFRRIGNDRVIADVQLYKNYRNRDLVLETIAETPDQIGLSIDFLPEFEITGDRALMRVARLDAVDIVDEGAITHRGLFLSAGVDTATKGRNATGEKPEPSSKMPTEPASNDQILSAMGKLTETVTGCMNAMTSALAKFAAPPVPPTEPEGMSALRTQMQTLATTQTALTEQLTAVQKENLRLKNERLLLGFRGTREQREQLGTSPEETVRQELAKQKTFTEMCRAHRETMKCKAIDASTAVLKTEEGRAAYRAHLQNRGVVRADAN
jgi:hypothetical protein